MKKLCVIFISMAGAVIFAVFLPQRAGATACFTGTNISSSPCDSTPGMQEVPDGANITACPNNLSFKGCSSAPKSGTGNVLCCDDESKTGEKESCGPNSSLDPNNTYQCVSSATECTKLKGKLFTPLQGQNNCSFDLQKGYGLKPCCQIPVPKASSAPKGGSTKGSSFNLANPLGTTSIPVIIGRIIAMFLGIVGAIALLVFVYGGVAWMTARGDAGQVKSAQAALKGAILGLVIISGSYLFADSFIKALTTQIQVSQTGSGAGSSSAESTQATQEQTSLEQQQAQAAAEAKAKAQGNTQTCVGDQVVAAACKAQDDCQAFCDSQWQAAGKPDKGAHPCTAFESGCPTEQVCCTWKK